MSLLVVSATQKTGRCYRPNNHNHHSDIRIKVDLYLHNSGENNKREEKNADEDDFFCRNLFHNVSP